MGLVVDQTDKVAHRIDLQDDVIIFTSPAFGANVANGRFSPDGNRLGYVDEDGKVFACDLDGDVWTVGDTKTIEWTTVDIQDVVIYFSADDGAGWTPLALVLLVLVTLFVSRTSRKRHSCRL